MAEDSKLTRWIAQNLGRLSPNEISEQTGVPPEDAVRRAQEYYDSVVLTAQQQYAQSVMLYRDMVNEAMERSKNASDRDGSAWVTAGKNALAQLEKTIADWEKRERDNSDEAIYARLFAKMIQSGLDRAIGVLSIKFPGIEAAEIQAELEKQILIVAAEHDKEA